MTRLLIERDVKLNLKKRQYFVMPVYFSDSSDRQQVSRPGFTATRVEHTAGPGTTHVDNMGREDCQTVTST